MGSTGTLSNSGLQRIRAHIIQDPVALQKWSLVKDNFVPDVTIRLQVESLLKSHKYAEAVLLTLESWRSSSSSCSKMEGGNTGVATVQRCISILRQHDLNKVADDIERCSDDVIINTRLMDGPTEVDGVKESDDGTSARSRCVIAASIVSILVGGAVIASITTWMTLRGNTSDPDVNEDFLLSSVTITNSGGSTDGKYNLSCYPTTGNHPQAIKACSQLDKASVGGTVDPFPDCKLPRRVYEPSHKVHVKGIWAGHSVNKVYHKGNSDAACEIWMKLSALFLVD